MNDRAAHAWKRVRSYVGRKITKIERLRYELEGVSDEDYGAMQVWFDGDVLRFEVSSDGESLQILDEPWRDPFAGPLSTENQQYLRTHGRWVLGDVSAESMVDTLIGQSLDEAMPLESELGKLVGVALRTGPVVITIRVEFDELQVTWGPNPAAERIRRA